MKKFLFTAIAFSFLIINASSAQIQKGAIWLGGQLGYSHQNTEYQYNATEQNDNYLLLSPSIGKAIKENLVLGVEATYSFYHENLKGTPGKTNNRSYGGGIFIRKYLPLAKGFSIFGQATIGGSAIHNKSEGLPGISDSRKGFSTSLSAYPGISFGINSKLQLETGFNNLLSAIYSSNKLTSQNLSGTTITKYRMFSVTSSLNNATSLYVGFRLLLNKQH